MMFALTAHPLDLNLLTNSLKEAKAGALVTFEGWVRNHNQGKAVSSLEYQVYEALAVKEGNKILQEAKEKFNLHEINCTHRYGHLKIGEIAVWAGASASHRDDAFQAARYVIDEIKTRLPIWKKEHYLNEAPEWVYCKDHSSHVHFSEAEYYQKQKSVVNQSRLKRKSVLVVGAGGLGCPALTALATAGVGKITILDFDRIELSNLHRQPLFVAGNVGEFKARIAQKRIAELNPFIEVAMVPDRLDSANAQTNLRGHDLVLDCTDNLKTKFILHDACFQMGIPLVAASIYRFEGQLRTYAPNPSAGCLRCQYPTAPEDAAIGNCNDFGVLGASVGALGSLQAGEAIQYLIRGKNASTPETIYFDLQAFSLMKIKNTRNKSCVLCSGDQASPEVKSGVSQDILEITVAELNEDFELVDIREQEDDYLETFLKHPKKIAVYCHRGVRSRRVVSQYRELGHSNFYSVTGGAAALGLVKQTQSQ